MLHKVDFYYFSPTGGTERTGEILANAMAEQVIKHNLMNKEFVADEMEGELAIFAAPVFAGRIPAVAAGKLKTLKGNGKKVVTLAVYGTRAYDDALMELNLIAKETGFQVIASGAFVAQHSVVPIVGTGRPDEKDVADLKTFAAKIMEKLEQGTETEAIVPGNEELKEVKSSGVTPMSTESCNGCGYCENICPTDAISMEDGKTVTDKEKCCLCMACVAHCPTGARILPPPVQDSMNEKLGALKDVRRENEMFL